MERFIAVFVYFAIIIIFIVRKVQAKKKDGRKTWTPPDRNADSGRFGTGGERQAWTPPEQASARPASPAARLFSEEKILSGIWEKLLGGEDDKDSGASSAADDGDDVVEDAWRQFRPDAEPDAPRIAAAPAASEKFVKADAAEPAREEKLPAAKTDAKFPPASGASRINSPLIAKGKSGEDFSVRLARLSPLQQAVIMAEVLGKPRGVKAYEDF